MNANIAEYHVPVNADVHDIKVIFVDERDELVNRLGIKGLGEIGIGGVAVAVANAVYHATGTRVKGSADHARQNPQRSSEHGLAGLADIWVRVC